MASNINEMVAIKTDLLRKSMEGDWDGVIDIYQKHPSAHKAKLTWNEDTALHIAVSDNKQEKVGRLMDIISCHHGEGKDQADEFKNKRGNTPLHLAASMGSATMCESIARSSFPLGLSFMTARNCKGETPLFLAALSCKKDALVSLHALCQDMNLNGYDFCRRIDDHDDTILHVAISIECFDMALEIIQLYPKLVHSINKQGLAPLHVLAGKPSAFKSCATKASYYKRSKKKGGETEDLENPQIRSSPRQDQHRGCLPDKQKRELASEVMNDLLERISSYELNEDGETDPNMIIGPKMVGDQKQKSPTDGSTSGLGISLSFLLNSFSFTHKTTKGMSISDAFLIY
ncbi:uncharacterized protein LOC118349190 [Juglans regia]|uniref:Uncharacterized protein LOC118349190 n=1 Tax=Juglans regia TaxID=51240 RepID=A0A6P9EJR4_JUGRE|nr:uncharacterized protein LOC118349190 [Juglans regia]